MSFWFPSTHVLYTETDTIRQTDGPLVPMVRLVPTESFHSRGQHLCKFIGTKESLCKRKEFNSHRTGLGHQHGRHFIVLGHQYGHRDVMWNTIEKMMWFQWLWPGWLQGNSNGPLVPMVGLVPIEKDVILLVIWVYQAPVVQKVDSAIHRINYYPVDSAISFRNTYPLDSDLSGG